MKYEGTAQCADSEDLAFDHSPDQFLKALQEFILPLMRDIDKARAYDQTKITSGPEAQKLISALQEFVSSIVLRLQMGVQTVTEASLIEEEAGVLRSGLDEDGGACNGEVVLSGQPCVSAKSSAESPICNGDAEGQAVLHNSQSIFQHNLMSALREHVFNSMPIRLLHFEPRGDSLQITLIDRTAIYAKIESVLQSEVRANYTYQQNEPSLIQRLISKHARYAILSHTWLRTTSGEVTFNDWTKGCSDTTGAGYRKLVGFCKAAWRNHGLTLGWMDTVCINKDSSSELDESIRSMYKWYQRASICLVHLSETTTTSDMHLDPWFTRGWTLQELLAPQIIKFYNSNWRLFSEDSKNDKSSTEIAAQIERATTISKDELYDLMSISRKMQLAASREVTRGEDTAYSLMGIFNVSFSIAYGEGAEHAFFRLLEAILTSSEDILDIFNWAGSVDALYPRSIMLPSSPKYYRHRSSNWNLHLTRPIEPLTITHLGLRMPLILMPAVSSKGLESQFDAFGSFSAHVDIEPLGSDIDIPTAYNLLDRRISGPDGKKKYHDYYQITFAVFAFDGTETTIRIPKTCMAIALRCREDVGRVTNSVDKIETNATIVFDLDRTSEYEYSDSSGDEGDSESEGNGEVKQKDDIEDEDGDYHWYRLDRLDLYHEVDKDKLEKHGMQLVYMYL